MLSVELVSRCTESKTLVGSIEGSRGMRPRVALAHGGVCRLLVSSRPSSRHEACARGGSTPSSIHALALAQTRTKQHVRCIHFTRHRIHTRWTRMDTIQLDPFHSMAKHVLKRVLIRSELTALPPRPSPSTKGSGRPTAHRVDCRRHDQRRTNVVQDQTIAFDIRLSNTLKYTNETTLDGIEHLRLFKSAVHAL